VVTAADNPYFARAVANRLWAQFLGRGLVHPVDDLSKKNNASHPALLEAMTKHLVATKFDLKNFMRELVNSDTYQLANTGPNTEAMPRWFERARVRPLSAEELMRTLRTATAFPADGFRVPANRRSITCAISVSRTTGRGISRAFERTSVPEQCPHVPHVRPAAQGNLTDTLLNDKAASLEEKVDRLFLSVLSRLPSAVERQRFVSI